MHHACVCACMYVCVCVYVCVIIYPNHFRMMLWFCSRLVTIFLNYLHNIPNCNLIYHNNNLSHAIVCAFESMGPYSLLLWHLQPKSCSFSILDHLISSLKEHWLPTINSGHWTMSKVLRCFVQKWQRDYPLLSWQNSRGKKLLASFQTASIATIPLYD